MKSMMRAAWMVAFGGLVIRQLGGKALSDEGTTGGVELHEEIG